MQETSPTRHFPSLDGDWKETPDGVRYQQIHMTPGDTSRPMLVLSDLPANYIEPAHTHDSNYVEIVIDGDITVGKVRMIKGDMRAMRGGAGYGPLTAGSGGCLRLTIFDRADGSMSRPVGAATQP
ncbi:MAG: hypothetical protein ABIQ81_00220 [Novosphingobium sp.]